MILNTAKENKAARMASQSPDLNPRLEFIEEAHGNLHDLKTVCVEEWAKITPDQCMRLVSPTGGILKLSLPTKAFVQSIK